MCKYCDCDNYEKCSIVGYIPIGFCCSLCKFYEEHKACVHEEEQEIPKPEATIKLIKSEIKNNNLMVTLEKEGKQFELKIDLLAYLK